MRVIAWIGLVVAIINVLVKLKETFTDTKVSDRVMKFIGVILNTSLLYFFAVYLFR